MNMENKKQSNQAPAAKPQMRVKQKAPGCSIYYNHNALFVRR